MAKLKEHGILFSSPMVKAILAGTKTQTRRGVRGATGAFWDHAAYRPVLSDDGRGVVGWECDGVMHPYSLAKAPHGPVGRRLYVKETWATSIGCDKRKAKDLKDEGWPIWYRADNKVRFLGSDTGGPAFMTRGKWRPSIFMPPWASRITLEVTRVRVERVGDISGEDVAAEGTPGMVCGRYQCARCNGSGRNVTWPDGCPGCNGTGVDAVAHYRRLWDEINGAGSFAKSPWVWVYDFRRVA